MLLLSCLNSITDANIFPFVLVVLYFASYFSCSIFPRLISVWVVGAICWIIIDFRLNYRTKKKARCQYLAEQTSQTMKPYVERVTKSDRSTFMKVYDFTSTRTDWLRKFRKGKTKMIISWPIFSFCFSFFCCCFFFVLFCFCFFYKRILLLILFSSNLINMDFLRVLGKISILGLQRFLRPRGIDMFRDPTSEIFQSCVFVNLSQLKENNERNKI